MLEGIAENASTMMAYAEDTKIKILHQIHYPHSLGFLWEKLSQYLSFTEYDAYKVMGMAAYGDASQVRDRLSALAQISESDFLLNPDILRFRLPDYEPLESLLGKARNPDEAIYSNHYHIAAALQEYTEEVILSLVQHLYQLYPSDNLCLAGEVALNCVCNWYIKEKGPYTNISILSAPHDGGTAIGAALYLYHNLFGKPALGRSQLNPYTGPSYSDEQIAVAIHEANLVPHPCHDPVLVATELVAEGKTVGWFQNRMELGLISCLIEQP